MTRYALITAYDDPEPQFAPYLFTVWMHAAVVTCAWLDRLAADPAYR